MKKTKIKREFYAYGSVLEALSFGLYPDKRHVIREFIQNAFDAIFEWIDVSGEHHIHPIEVVIQKPSIFIADKGLGMDNVKAQKFRYIGYSEKDKTKSAGFRGIGKDSGLSVAEKIIVTTSCYKNPNRYIIVIDAKKMLEETVSGRNPPLDELLEEYSTIKEEHEKKDAHYTFVELHNIRKDAQILFNIDSLKDYICRNTPVPFEPSFKYAQEVADRLKANILDFSYVDIMLNDEKLYKPFPPDYTRPEYEPIFTNDVDEAPLVAYCWYCGHKNKGQFPDKENRGLNYRIKNFAIGDQYLTRKTLWRTTPERAFYFFGEIHILDKEIIPSSDRTDFEDNEARTRLFSRCRRIAQILNQRAGTESEQRRFDESIISTEFFIEKQKKEIEKDEIIDQLKPELDYETRKKIEDIGKRLKRIMSKRIKSKKDKQLIKRGKNTLKKTKNILKIFESAKKFTNIVETLELNNQAKNLYQIVIDILKEEFSSDLNHLRNIIKKINNAIINFLKRD